MKQSRSLLHLARRFAALLQPEERRRFALLSLHTTANAVLEAIAAVFVIAIVSSLAPGADARDPVTSVARRVFPDDPDRRTIAIAVATLVFYVVKNLSGAIEHYFQQRLVHQVAARASTDVVAAYLRVPMSFHYLQSSGEFLRNAWSAADVVFRVALLAGLGILTEAMAAVALLAVLLIVAPGVTAAVIVGLVLMVGVMYRVLRPRMSGWGVDLQELSAASLQGIQEAFGAVRDARILGREGYFVDRYRASRGALAKSYWRSGTATNLPRFILETAFILAMICTVLLLTLRHTSSAASISLLGLYAYAGLRLMPAANRMVIGLNNLRVGEPGIDVMIDALEVPQDEADDSDEVVNLERAIVLERVSYRYAGAEQNAISDVSLSISRGESLGIVGPSGSGKSTLVDVIVGLLSPTEGRVLVDDVDIAHRRRAWRRKIGYVSQNVFLLDDTLRTNVAFGLREDEVSDARLTEAVDQAQLADFVRQAPLGKSVHVGDRGVRLSGGQRQRVAVARALYTQPPVLVFDEATAALDNRTEEELTTAIESLSRTKTVLIVAHRMTTVRNCDRVIFLIDGEVVDTGTYNELLRRNDAFRQFAAVGEPGSDSAWD